MQLVTVKRDPFARGDVVRKIERGHVGEQGYNGVTCSWCGNTRKDGSLFRYGWGSDDGRISMESHLFCSKSCHDSYNT